MNFWIFAAAFLILLWAFIVLVRRYDKLKKRNNLYRINAKDHAEAMSQSAEDFLDLASVFDEMRDIAHRSLVNTGADWDKTDIQNKYDKSLEHFKEIMSKFGLEEEEVPETL